MIQYANKLRVYKDCDDLFDNADSDTILKWINAYATMLDTRREHHRKYQAKKQLIAKIAARMLDPDELERIEQIAQRAAEDGGGVKRAIEEDGRNVDGEEEGFDGRNDEA